MSLKNLFMNGINHTKYSDGTWELKDLLINAEKNNVDLLSITDHDCVKAHLELQKINPKKYFSGEIITGAEFNCIFNNAKIELLGYNFDIIKMDEWLKKTYDNVDNSLKHEFDLFMSICHKNNIIVDDINYNENMGWPIDNIYKSIIQYPENKKLFTDSEWNDREHFFRCCTCNPNFPLYIDLSYQIPNAKIVSNQIKELGGKVFLAHLFTYALDDYKNFLDELVKENIIDGIEVYYSKFDQDQIAFLENYCKNNNLLMSAGSDCHGDKKPDRKVGKGYGNMNVSKDIVLPWIEKK